MAHVLITSNGTKFLLSENESSQVFAAVKSGEKKVVLQNSIISLQIIPEVLPFENWLNQETAKLEIFKKTLCRKCLGLIRLGDFCSCRDGSPPPNLFMLPVKELQLKLQNYGKHVQLAGSEPSIIPRLG